MISLRICSEQEAPANWNERSRILHVASRTVDFPTRTDGSNDQDSSLIPKLFLRLLWFFRQTVALFRQIRTFPQLFRFCSDLGNPGIRQIVREACRTRTYFVPAAFNFKSQTKERDIIKFTFANENTQIAADFQICWLVPFAILSQMGGFPDPFVTVRRFRRWRVFEDGRGQDGRNTVSVAMSHDACCPSIMPAAEREDGGCSLPAQRVS